MPACASRTHARFDDLGECVTVVTNRSTYSGKKSLDMFLTLGGVHKARLAICANALADIAKKRDVYATQVTNCPRNSSEN